MALVPQPTHFDEATAPLQVVVACTIDPLGFQGPLSIWLKRLLGLRVELQWAGFGTVLDMMRDPQSVWNTNRTGVNLLLLRLCDLVPLDDTSLPAARQALDMLVTAMHVSSSTHRGPTIVLAPPPDDGRGAESPASAPGFYQELNSALSSVDGVKLLDSAALSQGIGDRFYCAFLDRVAQAPYAPVAMSAFAGAASREIARAVAVGRKVLCLDCDNTLWDGAVAEVVSAVWLQSSLPIPTHPYPSLPIPTHPYPSLPIPTHPYPSLRIPSHPFPSLPVPAGSLVLMVSVSPSLSWRSSAFFSSCSKKD